jgi:hypothetical protein
MGGLLLVLLVCMPGLVLLVARLAQVRRPASDPIPASAVLPKGVIRHTAGWRWAGLVGGLAAGGVATASGALGRGLLLAAPVFALCILAGVVVGETSIRSPGGRTRIAALEIRRVRDYVPRRLAQAVFAAVTLLVALLTMTTATGAADDLGRSGRVVLLQCSQALQQGAGPWPGSFYSLPLGVMEAAGLFAAVAALRFVVRRPRVGADPAVVAADEALRRRAGQTITSACGILVALPLAGCGLLTAAALLSLTCRPAWLTVAAWSILALVPATLALISWCAAVLLVPTRGFSRVLPGT